METLKINGSEDTPTIILDKDNEYFELSGRSYPEDVVEVYQPALEWFEWYKTDPNPTTILHIKYEYFNTATSKAILELITKMEELYNQGYDAQVYWHYYSDDEEMLEAGNGYDEMFDIPFTFIVY